MQITKTYHLKGMANLFKNGGAKGKGERSRKIHSAVLEYHKRQSRKLGK